MSAQTDYWSEAVSNALEDAELSASPEQTRLIVEFIELANENYGQAFYQPSGPHHLQAELDQIKAALERERRKIACRTCRGSGTLRTDGPYHSAESTCYKCRGEGRVDP